MLSIRADLVVDLKYIMNVYDLHFDASPPVFPLLQALS